MHPFEGTCSNLAFVLENVRSFREVAIIFGGKLGKCGKGQRMVWFDPQDVIEVWTEDENDSSSKVVEFRGGEIIHMDKTPAYDNAWDHGERKGVKILIRGSFSFLERVSLVVNDDKTKYGFLIAKVPILQIKK